MSLLRADKIANRFNNTGPIIVGPSTVSGDFTVTGILTALGIGVTNDMSVGGALTTKTLDVTNGAQIFQANLTGVTTAGIITGATYYGNGVNLAGVVTSVFPGPGIQINPVSGQGRVQISANGVAVAGYSTNAGLATDVKGGSAGAVLYQVANNDTGFTAVGNNGEILQSTGAGSPIWTSLAAINVSYADSAGISTNLFGGSAGRIPYQSGIDQTAFFGPVTTGFVIIGQGSGAPIFVDPKASLNVAYATRSGVTTSLENGYISNASSMEVIGVTTLGITTARLLEVTGITTTNILNVGTAATIPNLTLSTGPGVGVTAILDEDDMVSDRVDALATQQSIKKYVDDQVTAQDLDGTADTGTFAIDLDSQTLDLRGDTNQVYITASGQTVNVGLDTNVIVPNNLVVSGFTSLSGLTTITGNLGVTGLTSTQFLDVSGVATVATLGVSGVTTSQFLEVTGVATVNTLGVTGITSVGILTAYDNVEFKKDLTVDGNAGIGSLLVTGVSTFQGNIDLGSVTINDGNFNNTNLTGVTTAQTLGVTGVTTTQSLEVIGVTTTGTLLVGSDTSTPGSTNYSSVTLSGQSSTSFNVTYTRQATGFVLDTGNIAGGSALFKEDSNYYYYVASSGPQANGRMLIYSEEDTAWHVVLVIGENFTEGNVSNNQALGSVTANEVVTGNSETGDGRNVPQSSATIVYPTSGGGTASSIGATITSDGNAIFAGLVTASSLHVTGITTLGVTTTTDLSADQISVSGLSTFVGVVTTKDDLYVKGNLYVTGDLDFDEFTARNANITGVATVATLGVTGVTTTQFLEVTGVSTLTGYVGVGSGLVVTGTGVTATTLNVSGASTVGFLTVTDSLYVSGIASVGAAITMYGAAGIVSATAFYGDGSNLTGVVGLVSVTNQLYVTPDGNDENDGYLVSTAKRTVGSALTVATPSTVVNISAGTYVENNPIILPEQVTLLGDSLREVSIVPQNKNADLIYVSNGSYVENMSFTGTLNAGKAIISFNPERPSFVTQGPYVRNCTNFISNSVGMKINGDDVIGPTRAMNVDSYTQLNQGGIGVSISNEGYAQLVSIFTIYNDKSVICQTGGQCDLTNSNSSFGTLGLIADGIGPTNFIGTVTEFVSANSNVFPIDLSTETYSIENAEYDQVSGLTTITTYQPIQNIFERGMSINLAGLGFTCPPDTSTFVSGTTIGVTSTGTGSRFQAQAGTTYDPATGLLVLNIGNGHGLTAQTERTATTGTAYDPATGILTVVTTANHGLGTGEYVKIAPDSLTFTCATDNNATNHTYPRAGDPIFNVWKQVTVVDATTFQLDVGVSSDLSAHTFVSATANGIKLAESTISIVDGSLIFTCATDGNTTQYAYPRFTDPASGAMFGLEATTADTITVNVGKSSDTAVHTFVQGVADGVVQRVKGTAFSPVTGTTYNDGTGVLVVDAGTSTAALNAADTFTATAGTLYVPNTGTLRVVTTASHGMTTGDLVKINQGALTFTCAQDSDATEHAYPRATDPVFNKWVQATVINATTFDINVGVTTTGDYDHTFVSGTVDGILKANSVLNFVDDSLTFTCSRDNNTRQKSYPRFTDPFSNQFVGVEAVAGDTFTVNIGQANLATFPDNFGRIFQVNSVLAGAGTSFTTYVGVSTLLHTYNSGGNTSIFTTRPFDGQVVYLDNIYNTIKDVTITDGGSGYTQPPTVTFSDPSESWGVKATGVARLTGDTVTSIDMISNGRGYTGNPTVTISGSATGVPNSLPTYYVVSSATPVVGGISTVTFTENVPYAVGVGTTVPFFKQSRILASSHAFEYIGSGNTFPNALPQRGGVAIPENEIVNLNGGLVIFTSTDQAGNFKIGEGVVINQLEGSITGDAYNRSLFANITPYILALGGGD